MTIPAEYQQAHTTLGCYIGGTGDYLYCHRHGVDLWSPDGCTTAIRAAREIGADALERARPLIEREAKAAALRDAADEWPGGPTGYAPVPAWWLHDRADRIEREGQV